MFSEASFIASEVLKNDYDFESIEIVYNTFRYGYYQHIISISCYRSVVSFRTTLQPYVPLRTMLDSSELSSHFVSLYTRSLAHLLARSPTLSLSLSAAMSIYDDCDAEVLRCYHEMTLANLIYYGLKEGACSEQSSRMTAMDAASKNASKIFSLTVTFISLSPFPPR